MARLASGFGLTQEDYEPWMSLLNLKDHTDELDLVREAANAAKLRRNFENSELIYIPRSPLVSDGARKVMVMERIYGIPVGEIERLKQAAQDFKVLAERGVENIFYPGIQG